MLNLNDLWHHKKNGFFEINRRKIIFFYYQKIVQGRDRVMKFTGFPHIQFCKKKTQNLFIYFIFLKKIRLFLIHLLNYYLEKNAFFAKYLIICYFLI